MAADDFTTTPTIVIPDPPEYNTLVTKSEGMAKQYQRLATTPTQKFKLIFKSVTYATYNTILAHYSGRYGQYDNFSWQSVPSYIDTDLDGTGDGTNMTGRWVEGSLKVTPLGASRCNVEIVFEKDV